MATEHSIRYCKRCLNSSANPTVSFSSLGLCHVCTMFDEAFDEDLIQAELTEFLDQTRRECLIGLSGGKDSTSTLLELVDRGFRPIAFTVDLGYYPEHIFDRAYKLCQHLDIPFERFDARPLIRKIDRESYRLTADLYDSTESHEMTSYFRGLYATNRKHYSIKCLHAMPFVRPCQLCRRTVIRAYSEISYLKRVPTVVLGINEWTALARTADGKPLKLSGFRWLQNDFGWRLRVVHLPFLLRRSLSESQAAIQKIGWTAPPGEDLVETSANSCLIARASERIAFSLLGFHPDAPRLAREVTAGFLPREAGIRALEKEHPSEMTVRELLESAAIL